MYAVEITSRLLRMLPAIPLLLHSTVSIPKLHDLYKFSASFGLRFELTSEEVIGNAYPKSG